MFRLHTAIVFTMIWLSAALVMATVGVAQAAPSTEWQVLAYTGYGKQSGVYFFDLSRRITAHFAFAGTGGFKVSWSPDGRALAYVSYENAQKGEDQAHGMNIRVLDIDTGDTRNLTASLIPSLTYDWPSWSPDGTLIAFYAHLPGEYQGLNVINLADGQVRNLVHGNSQPGSITWSPDSREIAYVARSDSNIYRVDLATGKRQRLTNHSGIVTKYRLAWWDDKIAYIRDGRSIGWFRIAVLDLASGRTWNSGPEHRFIRDVWWSSDGQRILFSSTSATREPYLAFYEMRLNGSPARLMSQLDYYVIPAFRPT